MITIKNTQKKVNLSTRAIRAYVQRALQILNYPTFDVGIWFTTNKTIKSFNKKYRHKNMATDILSFAYHAGHQPTQRIHAHTPEDKNLGDLIVSTEFVQKTATQMETPFEKHLKTVLLHGICHLIGHDHATQKDFDRMQALEKKLFLALETKTKRKAPFIN